MTQIGIIIPLEAESECLKNSLTEGKEKIIDGIQYQLGSIHQKEVVLINSGMGKVNAAIAATRLIKDFQPSLVMIAGSAGNLNPRQEIGDVVIGEQVVDVDLGKLTGKGVEFEYHQYLYNPQDKREQPLMFDLDTKIKQAIANLNLPRVRFGKVATSDALPNQPKQVALLEEAGFDVVEMEGSAVMQTCWQFGVQSLVVRGVSNHVHEAITHGDIELAADQAVKALISIICSKPL